MAETIIYTVGGTVQAGGGIYIPRLADKELLNLCRKSTFAYVLTPRQMGKSSLMVCTANMLREEGINSVVIDLQELGAQVTAEQWYFGFLVKLDDQLMLDTDVKSWWEIHSHLGVSQRLTLFFEQVLLSKLEGQVVIFVDEIDSTLSLDFTDDFFIAIRYLYVARATNAEFNRLSFVLLGVGSPGDLIQDAKRTPFNIGQRVDLTDFTFEEALPLAKGLGLSENKEQQVLQWVLKWTRGHPYLTQRLCAGVVKFLGDSEQGKQENIAEEDIKAIVSSTFFGMMSEQDNNLQFVRDMLTKRAPSQEVLTVYREIHDGRRVVLDEEQSLAKSHLKLSGVVRREHNTLQVRNLIYKKVFDRKWLNQHLRFKLRDRWEQLKPGLPYVIGLLIFSGLMIGVSIYVNDERLTAQQARDSEKLQREKADQRTREALEARKIAEQQRKEADIQRQKAKAGEISAKKAQQISEQRGKRLKEAEILARKQQKEAEKQRDLANNAKQDAIQRRINAELQAESLKSQNLFAANLELDALIVALKAGKSLKEHSNIIEADNRIKVILALEQVVDKIKENNRLEQHSSAVVNVNFSPDGKTIASASWDGTVKLWNLSGKLLHTLVGHNAEVVGVKFSPNGKTIVSISRREQKVKLWNVSGRLLHTFDEADSVKFSPDSKTIATVSQDKKVKLWNVSGQLLHTFDEADSVKFSPDSKTIATVSQDKKVKL
ncbi:MAG: AAA-like domain-containing protein, partial [Nostoc sp.]|uniref:AAA-like domain-containing protein n=1 Tax=Nostoc sp. TaxID=1180 RepID=UPI002FFCE9E8